MKNPGGKESQGFPDQPEDPKVVTERALDIMETILSLNKQLQKDKYGKGLAGSMWVAIEKGHRFIDSQPEDKERPWYGRLQSWIKLGEVAFGRAMVYRIDRDLIAKYWDKEEISIMTETIDLLEDCLIPRLKQVGQETLIKELETCLVAMRMKIRADTP